MIHLSDSDVAGLSGGVREFMTSESDLIASAGNYGEELDRASRTKNILPSLKYFFPQVPKPNEKARPLTSDQKAQNVIFMREARKLWRKAGAMMQSVTYEYLLMDQICIHSIFTLLWSYLLLITLYMYTDEELNNRVVEYVAKMMRSGGKKGSALSGQNSLADVAESERSSKGRAEQEIDSRGMIFVLLLV